jgi:hypothetical protein
VTRPRRLDADNPAAVYRDSLSRGSYWAVHHSLETIVKLLGGADPWSYPWHRLRYREDGAGAGAARRALRAGDGQQDPVGAQRCAQDLLAGST